MSITWHSMDDIPPKVTGEHFSETVLIYDGESEYQDLGYYDFGFKRWNLLGDSQMKMTCWIKIPELSENNKEFFKSKEVISSLSRRKSFTNNVKSDLNIISKFDKDFLEKYFYKDNMTHQIIESLMRGKTPYEALEYTLVEIMRLYEITVLLMQCKTVPMVNNYMQQKIDEINKKYE